MALKDLIEVLKDDAYFETVNHKYRVIEFNELSFDEYRQFERYEFQTGTGLTFEYFFTQITSAITMFNKLQFAQLGKLLVTLADSCKDRMENKYNNAFYLCTLFTRREDHDVREWSVSIAEEYIEDWKKEYSVMGFFLFATNFVRGWTEAYAERSLSISESQKPEKGK